MSMLLNNQFKTILPCANVSSLGAVSLLEDVGTGLAGVPAAAAVVEELELSEVVLPSNSCEKYKATLRYLINKIDQLFLF